MNNKKEEFSESISKWMKISTHMYMHKMHNYAKEKNISFIQMNCMFRIKKHGSLQVKDVGKMFGFSAPGASQLLEKLTQMDYLERKDSSEDRRVKYHDLTPKGEKLVNDFFTSINELKVNLIDSFDPDEYENYTKVLNNITNKLQKMPIWGKEPHGGNHC